MNERNVVLGEIVLNGESIALRAEIAGPIIPARVELIKYKLAYLLDTRFKPAPPPERKEMTIDELTARWKCHRVTILRRIQMGDLHPIGRGRAMRFDREEIDRLSTSVYSLYPR